jgi:autotransporter translocation and assembly factor TamB
MDPLHGTASARGLIVRQGPIVFARASLATFSGMPIGNISQGTVHVHLIGIEAEVTRLPNGQFDIAQLLSKQKGPPSSIPFEITATDSRVRVVDQGSKTPWVQKVTIPTIKASGLGDDLMVGGGAVVDQAGSLTFQARRIGSQQWRGQVLTSGFELANLIRHVQELPEYKHLQLDSASIASAKVTGPVDFQVDLPDPQAIHPLAIRWGLTSDLRTAISGARYGPYSAKKVLFDGTITDQGLNGTISAQAGPNRAQFRGEVGWKKPTPVSIIGKVWAFSPTPKTLPSTIATKLPHGAIYRDLRFVGWIDAASLKKYRLSGTASATRVDFKKEHLDRLVARIDLDPSVARAHLLSAQLRGRSLQGFATIAPPNASGALAGAFKVENFDLGPLSKDYRVAGLTGNVSGKAIFGGNLKTPTVSLASEGTVGYRRSGHNIRGDFVFAGQYSNERFEIERALLTGDFGQITAHGAVSKRGQLSVGLTGRRLNAEAQFPELMGNASLRANLSGTVTSPLLRGYAEAYGLTYHDYSVPVASVDFTADLEGAQLLDFKAIRGSAQLTGSASVRFRDGALKGQMVTKGFQLADILGDDFSGTVEIPDGILRGTLSKPIITSTIRGENVVAKGLKVDKLSAKISADNKMARLENLKVSVANGQISGSANFDLLKRNGNGTLKLDALALKDIVPNLSTAVTVVGTASGKVNVTFDDKSLLTLLSTGTLNDIELNDTPVGSGSWDVTGKQKDFNGSVQVGFLDRYVSLDNGHYNSGTNQLGANLSLFNNEVKDLTAIGARYLPDLSLDTAETLKSASGTLNLGAKISGSLKSPVIAVDNLTAASLRVRNLSLGDLKASLDYQSNRLDVHSFSLSGGSVTAKASGYLEPKGNIQASLDISNVAMSDIGQLVPSLAGQSGKVTDLSIDLFGKTNSPDVHASLDAEGLLQSKLDLFPSSDAKANAGIVKDKALRLSLIANASGQDKTMDLSGDYFFRGFQGNVRGTAVYELSKGIPKIANVDTNVSIAKRDLKEVAQLVTGIDLKRTSGYVEGGFQAKGSPEDLAISGDLTLFADSLGFEVPATNPKDAPVHIDDSLRNVQAKIAVANHALGANATFESSRGGKINSTATIPIDDISQLQTDIQNRGIQAILDRSINGSVTIDGFSVRQGFPSNAYVLGKASGAISIAGTIGQPNISGNVSINQLESVLPALPSATGTASVPVIDPTFNLTANLGLPARLKTTGAELFVLGGGTLTGSLSAPTVRSKLELQSGSVRLPAALLRLDQGGTVALNLDGANPTILPTLDVDMVGKTAVTTLKSGDIYERYDISIGLKGDLLKDGGLVLTAQSDPPDLTQDRILALVGQTDLLQSFNSGASQGDTERKFRDALAGYALPSFADPITSKLAQTLGLQYLNVEYNGVEQASFALAKGLGGGFSIQGRRQFAESPLTGRTVYELKVSYHPRRAKGLLGNISFSVGSDQDHPIKGALEYGIKF